MIKSQIPPLVSSDPRVSVGRFTYGTPKLRVWGAEDTINIGSFCSIADDVVIMGGGEHRPDWVTTYPLRIAFGETLAGIDGHPATKGPTHIGSDVWIGHGAIILSGVRIGNGAVVAAGAVVSRSVEDYAIVAGNPARVVRKRFDPEQIAALLEIAWWDWPIERIHAAQALLCCSDIRGFIEQARLIHQDVR